MTDEYDNEMRGVMFLIPEDKRADKGPIMRGSAQIEGVQYRLSIWSATSQKGVRYWQIRFQVDDGSYSKKQASDGKSSASARRESQAPLKGETDGDDIPF